MIKFSAPGKIYLLGEHSVVYGRPALLTTVDLRVRVTLKPCHSGKEQSDDSRIDSGQARMTKIIESIIKKELKIKQIPPYNLTISSQIPIGAGLGSSAAISASYIAVLLSFLKVNWDLNLINKLTFEAEKVFHGHPSGADNTTTVYGGLIWYVKGKGARSLSFTIPANLAKNFILINTGTPKESTKEMVEMVSVKFKAQSAKFQKIFNHQEQLVRELLVAIQNGNEDQLIRIIRAGEKNLENMDVVSDYATSIIRKIETAGGAAKICGGGGKSSPTGVLLCYHSNPSIIKQLANSYKLDYIKANLGVTGLRQE